MKSTERWELWLVAAGAATALAVAVFAFRADRAQRERHALALEGRVLRLAHEIELDLREHGEDRAREILERRQRSHTELVRGLALADPATGPKVRVGVTTGPAAQQVEIFLPRMQGSRLLHIHLVPGVARRPLGESVAFWGGLNASGLLFVLAVLGAYRVKQARAAAEREETRRRLESLARAGAGLAHQIRNPLATIKGSAQLLLEGGGAGDRRVERIVEQAGTIEQLLDQLLDFARPPRAEPAELDVGPVLDELASREPRLRVTESPTRRVLVDPGHFEQILRNLVSNSLELDPSGAPVEIGARTVPGPGGGIATIWVRDRGPGPGPDPESLFLPYVTSRTRGTGLGLPIARALAEANAGSLSLAARTGGGACATLSLPLADDPVEPR